MENNQRLAIVLGLLIVLFIIWFQLTLNQPLNDMDGSNHYEFVNVPGCASGYSEAICYATNWMNLNEFGFWLVFLIISLMIPLFLVFYFKNVWLFVGWFFFTGFFWNTMTMQVFAQLLLSLFFVFFIFEPKQKPRLIILGSSFLLFFLGVRVHNSGIFVLCGVLLFEMSLLVKKEYLLLGCGILPSNVVSKVGFITNSVRSPMNNNVGSFFQSFVYYFYNLLVENMLFVFIVPGFYEIIKSRNFRLLYYFCFVVFGGLFVWWFQGWRIWGVTRVVIWLPLILFVPFIDWLQRQHHFTKVSFVFVGGLYFCFNVWYYLQRVGELNC